MVTVNPWTNQPTQFVKASLRYTIQSGGHVLEWKMDFEVHVALVTRSVAPADFSKLGVVVLPV